MNDTKFWTENRRETITLDLQMDDNLHVNIQISVLKQKFSLLAVLHFC